MSVYLPNPCLQGIVLSISTHNGPQLVFHYPPNPKDYEFKSTPFDIDNDLMDSDGYLSEDTDASSSDESADESVAESAVISIRKSRKSNDGTYVSGQTLLDMLDQEDKKKRAQYKKRLGLKKSSISSRSGSYASDSVYTSNSFHIENQVRDKIFGFEYEFLAEIISPTAPELCNTRFELCVDDMTFLGLPIRVNQDGLWRSSKHDKNTIKSKHSTVASNSKDEEIIEEESEVKDIREDDNFMNMFHVVFIMNPPVVEYDYRINEMFHFVVSRLSLVLRYEQAKSNYVWNECKKILKIKDENYNLSIFELYEKLTIESSLAKTLKNCYDSISTSKIANLEINNKLITLQIPLKNQFKSLLPKTTPVLPGSYLSSIIMDNEDDQNDEDMGYLALLLLDDPQNIISDLKTENSPLALFVEKINPMISLKTLALNNNLDLSQICSFAEYLIYWRRARIMIPLHTKSIFIVSPMAPLQKISTDLITFKTRFPSLPSLPSFLSLLSNSKPRQYSSIIPSKDHKEIYLDALTWLIRHGYVTQLLTFVWLKIPARIKIAVDEDLEREGLTKRRDKDVSQLADIATDNTSKQVEEGLNETHRTMTTFSSTDELIIKEEEEDETIILDPERATAIERRWFAKVIKGQPNDIVVLFHKLLKYFNGKSPLELVIIKENISRQELRKLLHAISANITSVKHW